MDRITAITVFVQVADRGSLTAASEALSMSRAMVSRYLSELENWLGARVFHRTTRRLSLTPAGEAALSRCRTILELGEDMRAALADPDDAPHGRIRITCSTSFGLSHLAAAVADYVARYPGTAVDMMLMDRAVNLVEERIDLAIRISGELDSGLIARKFSVCRSVLCASPAYLSTHGVPLHPEDLAMHNCLTHHYVGRSLWHLERAGQTTPVAVGGNISANEATALLQAVRADAGIAMLPTYLVSPLIRRGELVVVLPDYAVDSMGIYGVYTSRRQMPLIVRSFLDFLAARFGEEPEWDRLIG
ncbi:LysR family transcriptional regulator [Pseudoxanthomonas sacheonensis]|uniref:DNA-binding transcriptional LysR family regulator n=1 Tax=Pseudoxanthomonas sacheonensis TaxID=443615 RepID=A0ABU1RPQ9_9GAMM|nr:LysR family transcriptional regulator [Pseudoxanthomonas sacheonensis]MDR6840748.1 DNA-binding transcriptional LysR family regulator [Pseudoxanthomonas sacheonensis]